MAKHQKTGNAYSFLVKSGGVFLNKTKIIITAAMLAVVSMVMQFAAVESGTGMNLDLVAVPWVLSAYLLGPLGGAITTIAAYLFIALQSSAGWVGATIKLIASIPLVAAFAFLSLRKEKPSAALLGVSLLAAVILRVILAHAVNAAFTFPMFSIPVDAQIGKLFSVDLGFSISWIFAIDALNVVQSLIEFAVCYILLFRTRIRERLRA